MLADLAHSFAGYTLKIATAIIIIISSNRNVSHSRRVPSSWVLFRPPFLDRPEFLLTDGTYLDMCQII